MQTIESDPEKSKAAITSIAVVFWMWIAYFLNYSDRQAIFTMFKALKEDLQMTDLQLGLTGTIFLWVYGLGCPIAGMLADRFPKGKLVVLSLVLWSGVTILTGLSTSATMLLSLRAAMGISEALFMPAAIALTSESTPARWRSKAVASLTTAQIAGIVAGASFGGWMAQSGRWRMAFFILGAVGILYAVPYAWFFLRRNSKETDQADETVKSGTEVTAPYDADKQESKIANGPWYLSILELLSVPTYFALCLIFPLFVFGLWMIYSWLARYIEEQFGLTSAQAGLTSTIYLQSATLCGLFVGGYVADYWKSTMRSGRFLALLVSLIGCAPLLVAIGQVNQLAHLKVTLVAYGFLSGWMMGNIFPAAFEVIAPKSRATAVGILNLFGAILSGFAPLLVGYWKELLGLPGMLWFAALAYLCAAVMLVFTIVFLLPQDYRSYDTPNLDR